MIFFIQVRSIHSEVEMATLLTEDRLSEVKADDVVVGEDMNAVKEKYEKWAEEFSAETSAKPTAAERYVR